MTSLHSALRNQGVYIETGPFVSLLRSPIFDLADSIQRLYHPTQLSFDEKFADFHLTIKFPSVLRRYVRRQISFYVDERSPFHPLPFSQFYPFFEWGLNWCIANFSNHLFIIHAAVVEKNGYSIVFPADPGSGKSTLCAGLVGRGWRLLSDEMAIIDPSTMRLIPVVRPISLKNDSIRIIRNFVPEYEFGEIVDDTNKGTVTHVKPPVESVIRGKETAEPKWLIFPKYEAGAISCLRSISKPRSVLMLGENSFNYNILGEKGFFMACSLVDVCDCYEFSYSDLDDAVKIFDRLVSSEEN